MSAGRQATQIAAPQTPLTLTTNGAFIALHHSAHTHTYAHVFVCLIEQIVIDAGIVCAPLAADGFD